MKKRTQAMLWMIKLSIFLNYFIFAILLNSVGTVILQVQHTYGVDESAAGILEAFKDLSIAITSFAVSSFVVRIGYKPTMLFALAFVAAVCLAMPQVPSFWMTKLLFAAIGVGFALIKVSVFASLGLVTRTKEEHASTMNFVESFFMIGVLSGYFIFSSFVDDENPASLAWLNVYYVLAALCALAFILLLFVPIDESEAQKGGADSLADNFVQMLRLCLETKVVLFVMGTFLYVLIEQSIMTWLPTFNNRILNMSPSLSIQVTSILAASTAAGRFAAGFVLNRVEWLKFLLMCLFGAALLVVLALPLAQNSGTEVIDSWLEAPLAAFLFPLIGMCIAPIYPAINSLMLSALPKNRHASMAGLIVVFSALGGTLGSILTGLMFRHFDGVTAFYSSLIPMLAVAIVLTLFKRQPDPTWV
ncbi:MAG: MFS transporter [Myxococcota bacterium]